MGIREQAGAGAGRSGTPTVKTISIAPVKGFAVSSPRSVTLTPEGVLEDRRFVVVDAGGRRVGPLRHGDLLRMRADYDARGERLTVHLPDGRAVEGTVALGRTVRVELWSGRVDGRVVGGPWAEAIASVVGERVELVRVEPPASANDASAVSLVSEASLRGLAAQAGDPIDARRFRMLFTVGGCAPHEEEGWVGRTVGIGSARIRVTETVGRCAVTSLDPDSGRRDRNMLEEIRAYRGLSEQRTLDLGVYATVEAAGTVRVGDHLAPDTVTSTAL